MDKNVKVPKGYRIPASAVAEAQRLARESKGLLRESDVIRIAIQKGLPHVARLLPTIAGEKSKP